MSEITIQEVVDHIANSVEGYIDDSGWEWSVYATSDGRLHVDVTQEGKPDQMFRLTVENLRRQ